MPAHDVTLLSRRERVEELRRRLLEMHPLKPGEVARLAREFGIEDNTVSYHRRVLGLLAGPPHTFKPRGGARPRGRPRRTPKVVGNTMLRDDLYGFMPILNRKLEAYVVAKDELVRAAKRGDRDALKELRERWGLRLPLVEERLKLEEELKHAA